MNLTSEEFQKFKARALRLLARRDHSRLELRLKLKQRMQFDSESFDKLIDELRVHGYMADENDLAQRHVQHWRDEGRGRQWISGKLRLKGLPQVSLQDDEVELTSAKKYLEKKTGVSSFASFNQVKRTQVANALIRRGFTTGLVMKLLKEKTSL